MMENDHGLVVSNRRCRVCLVGLGMRIQSHCEGPDLLCFSSSPHTTSRPPSRMCHTHGTHADCPPLPSWQPCKAENGPHMQLVFWRIGAAKRGKNRVQLPYDLHDPMSRPNNPSQEECLGRDSRNEEGVASNVNMRDDKVLDEYGKPIGGLTAS